MYGSSDKMEQRLAAGRRLRLGSGIAIAVVLLMIIGAVGFHLGAESRGSSASSGPVTVPATPGITSAIELGKAFGEVAQRVEPAVVNINTEQIVRTSGNPLEEFFGVRGMPREFRRPSLGSGFIVDPNGYILTNHHVVGRADRISVKLNDGRTLDATVVGTDPQTDLAVIRIKETNLPYLRLADSNKVGIGDWALAFGSPFGLEKTMTTGIISAKGRVIGAGPYDDFLQTDAAINPGNSGGPLVNLQGEVVGINTMIVSQNGGFQGVGFAIPSSMAAGVYRQLADTGKVTRGWMGIGLEEVTPEAARRLGLPDTKGALVREVQPGSPAERAGLQRDDVIVGYNGREMLSPRNLSLAVAESRPDTALNLSILRAGRKMALAVKLGEKPAQFASR